MALPSSQKVLYKASKLAASFSGHWDWIVQRARWAVRVFCGKGEGSSAVMGMERRWARRVRSAEMYLSLSVGVLSSVSYAVLLFVVGGKELVGAD